ncbi:HlyD family secretion protein [Algoriphagus sp.]|jgi:multidrug resistance efflux pump|uniref:HlyD family secretion protein n=1 Tax=Algoriphagus sp. TaxID=1872435 RepID=UPI002717F3DD|nr:HlyD family efflux transporter periplasmic adaptor subunit [Algoriphagus sp.]MDO8965174.1 HlyD family efflux transporter periplasmic adaptor subunit [Algoriphagus sp.]MDP3201718.1 HlyD family efflux transporter periplasmic adaptor subunit [Algoriphagus sp.]
MPENPHTIDNLQLRSEEVQEIITTPPAWLIRWGITLVFLITFGLIFLSFFIKYPDFIMSRVMVTTVEPTEKMIARTSGQIDRIWVSNGEKVKVGQLLASIKSTADVHSVLLLKKILDEIPFGKNNGFFFPLDSLSDVVLGEIELAFVEFERGYMEFRLLERLQPSQVQLEGNRLSILEIHERLTSQLAQKEILERKVILVETDFKRNKMLYEGGVIAAKDFESREMEYLQVQEQVNGMAISISQLQEALVNAGQTLKSTQVSKEQDESRALISLIQSYHGLKRAVKEWERNYVLVSSTDGEVSFQGVWGEHQFVQTGEHVFTILPDQRSELLGKMTVSSQNAGKISMGQRVLIKLDNFPFQQFGTLRGEVGSISVSPDEEGNYVVYSSLPEGTKTSYGKEIQLKQELLGTAEIITEDLSVAERLFFKLKSITEY